MKNWKDYVNEVEEKGFGNASPIARLIWSCEVDQINQHASPDLILIADVIEAAQNVIAKRHTSEFLKAADALATAFAEMEPPK